MEKTPRIAAWCRPAFRFNVLYSSNFDGTSRIRGLPRGRFQPTAPLRARPLPSLRLDSRQPSGTSFWFCGVPLRRALIFLGLFRVTPSRSRPPLQGTSSFAWVRQPRSDFTICRVERLPSGTCVSDLPQPLRTRFEAFPAVYRAPSLFWHRSGYVFPEVYGLPLPNESAECSQPRFQFH